MHNNTVSQFTIRLVPKTKGKINLSIKSDSKNNGRIQVMRSREDKTYIKEAGNYLKPLRISYPVNVKVLFYVDSHRHFKLVNLLQMISDVLIKNSVICDGNNIIGYDGSRILYDKHAPRTEILISRMEHEEE